MRAAAVRALLCLSVSLPAAMDAGGAFLTVTDDAGHPVTLTAPAQRVITLAPHLAELVGDLGAEHRLIGVSSATVKPAMAAMLPHVGQPGSIDVEAIAALHPDLVLAWSSGTPAGQLDALRRLGIPVFESEPRHLQEIASTLTRLGLLLGQPANKQVKAFQDDLARLNNSHDPSGRPVRVVFQVWDAPLMVIGGRQIISEVIQTCGGSNPFQNLDTPAAEVTPEAALGSDPQLIVQAGPGEPTAPFLPWSRWPAGSSKRQFLTVPAGEITESTPELLVGAKKVCTAIDRIRHAPAIGPQ